MDSIFNAVYNQQWYSLHPKDAKNLILLLIRSRKSTCLTAGKVFYMTMPTFCNVRYICRYQIIILVYNQRSTTIG